MADPTSRRERRAARRDRRMAANAQRTALRRGALSLRDTALLTLAITLGLFLGLWAVIITYGLLIEHTLKSVFNS